MSIDGPPLVEGWLYKLKSKRIPLLDFWNIRYVTIQYIGYGDLCICYYDKKGKKDPNGWIFIKEIDEIYLASETLPHTLKIGFKKSGTDISTIPGYLEEIEKYKSTCFIITAMSRNFVFHTNSSDDFQRWISALYRMAGIIYTDYPWSHEWGKVPVCPLKLQDHWAKLRKNCPYKRIQRPEIPSSRSLSGRSTRRESYDPTKFNIVEVKNDKRNQPTHHSVNFIIGSQNPPQVATEFERFETPVTTFSLVHLDDSKYSEDVSSPIDLSISNTPRPPNPRPFSSRPSLPTYNDLNKDIISRPRPAISCDPRQLFPRQFIPRQFFPQRARPIPIPLKKSGPNGGRPVPLLYTNNQPNPNNTNYNDNNNVNNNLQNNSRFVTNNQYIRPMQLQSDFSQPLGRIEDEHRSETKIETKSGGVPYTKAAGVDIDHNWLNDDFDS